MNHYAIRLWVLVSLLGGMFVLRFVSGSVSQRPAQAQGPGVGGALGSVQELGSSIAEIQQHVDGLQKISRSSKKAKPLSVVANENAAGTGGLEYARGSWQ
jgi:hypothetical protein